MTRWIPVFLVGWCLSLSVAGAQAPLEEATDQLKKIRTHLNAVSNRFNGGFKAVSPSGDSTRPATPAMECCEANLRVVRDRLVGFSRAVRRLTACYEQSGDRDSLTRARVVRTDIEDLARGLETFLRAPSHTEAGRAMSGTTRVFILLDKDFRTLTSCELADQTPVIEPEPPTSDPSVP